MKVTKPAKWRVSQRVFFGRPKGARTLGVITKLNKNTAKVKQLENRQGQKNCYKSGTVWNVPYSYLSNAPKPSALEKSLVDCLKLAHEERAPVEVIQNLENALRHSLMSERGRGHEF